MVLVNDKINEKFRRLKETNDGQFIVELDENGLRGYCETRFLEQFKGKFSDRQPIWSLMYSMHPYLNVRYACIFELKRIYL